MTPQFKPIEIHDLTSVRRAFPNAAPEEKQDQLLAQVFELFKAEYGADFDWEDPAAWKAAFTLDGAAAVGHSTVQLVTALLDDQNNVIGFSSIQVYPADKNGFAPSLNGYTVISDELKAADDKGLQAITAVKDAALAEAVHFTNEHGISLGIVIAEHGATNAPGGTDHETKGKAALAAHYQTVDLEFLPPSGVSDTPTKLYVVFPNGADAARRQELLLQVFVAYTKKDGAFLENPEADPRYGRFKMQVAGLFNTGKLNRPTTGIESDVHPK